MPDDHEVPDTSRRALRGLTVAEARDLVALQAMMRPDGLRCVLLTSLATKETPPGSTDLLAAEGGECHRLRTPLLPIQANGAGDAIAALFLFHRLDSGNARAALEQAGSSIHGLLARTAAAGFIGSTWPMMSQSNSIRTAASCCFTPGAPCFS